MAITSQSSVLSSAANKIVSANVSSTGSFITARKEYQKFGDFLYIKTLEIERSETPNQNTLKKLSRLNISNTFGSAGGLLGSLLGGALDLGGLIRGFFPGKDKKIGQAPSATTAKSKPKMKGSRLRISGGRALPIVGTLFAGLDFATGLAEGESIGKSAAGTAGSLAGSLLGGAIGQTLIPVPGLGFVIGSAVGGFLGGWTADRAYDAGASMLSKPKAIQEQKLEEGKKKEEPKVKEDTGLIMRQNSLITNFDGAVNKFSELVDDFISGKVSIFSQGQFDENYEPVASPTTGAGSGAGEEYTGPVSGDTFLPLPNAVSIGHQPSQAYGVWRVRSGGRSGDHMGVDLTEALGSPRPLSAPVVAYKTGTVKDIVSTNSYGPGGMITLNHGGGLETVYIHIIPRKGLKSGDIVYGGQEIAKLWPDGGRTHLHFEVKQNGKNIDPTGYARGAKNKLTAPLSDLSAKLQHEKNAGTQSQLPAGSTKDIFNLEIHSPGPKEGQRSGLIRSMSTPENAMSSSFVEAFGSYEKGFRDLGGPKKGLNLLETDMKRGVEYNAQRIMAVIQKHPDIHVNVFAGHNDLRRGEGETGTEGEMEYTKAVVERLEQLARERGVRNFTYVRSEYAREGTDPKSNWSKSQRKIEEFKQGLRSQASAVPTAAASRNIAYNLPYNQQGSVGLNNLIAMVQQQSLTPPRVVSTPYTMASNDTSMSLGKDNNSSDLYKQLQILNLSVA